MLKFQRIYQTTWRTISTIYGLFTNSVGLVGNLLEMERNGVGEWEERSHRGERERGVELTATTLSRSGSVENGGGIGF